MPAVSQQQQKLFGLALAVKRGEVARSEASDEVLNIVDSMSEKDIEDFASTSHEGLPKQVEARLRETLRELMREMAIEEAELPAAPIPSVIKAKLAQAIDKIKDTNLNYNQKLQVIGKVIDSLGVDKKELAKMSSKLKTTLESLNEDDPCWKDYEMIGMKKKDGKEVPNCVPKSESVNEAEFGEKIQKLNNRITKLRGDLARTKSDNQKNVLQARLKNALQSLSDTKKSLGIKAPHTESVNESLTANDGKIVLNGKIVGYYDYDRGSSAFWTTDLSDTQFRGSKAFDTKEEMLEFFKKYLSRAAKGLEYQRKALAKFGIKYPADESVNEARLTDIVNSIVETPVIGKMIRTEAKKYDIGSGWMGNGLTIWNRAEEEHGDYKIIAHISPDGKLSIRDKQLPSDIKKMFQMWADTMKKGDRPGIY